MTTLAIGASSAFASSIAITDTSVAEGNSGTGTLNFEITGSCDTLCTIHWQTADGTATVADGDYSAVTDETILTYHDSPFSIPVAVDVHGDAKPELDESLELTATLDEGGPTAATPGTGTIVDDDAPPTQVGTDGADEQTGTDDDDIQVGGGGGDTQRGGGGSDAQWGAFSGPCGPTTILCDLIATHGNASAANVDFFNWFGTSIPTMPPNPFVFTMKPLLFFYQELEPLSPFAGVFLSGFNSNPGPYGAVNLEVGRYRPIARAAPVASKTADRTDTQLGEGGVDFQYGGAGGDVQKGGPGSDLIMGGYGKDRIGGGGGQDIIFAGPGADRVSVADGEKDYVRCGNGEDRTTADRADVLRGCEQVTERKG